MSDLGGPNGLLAMLSLSNMWTDRGLLEAMHGFFQDRKHTFRFLQVSGWVLLLFFVFGPCFITVSVWVYSFSAFGPGLLLLGFGGSVYSFQLFGFRTGFTPFKASAWVYPFFGFQAPVIPFRDWDFVL